MSTPFAHQEFARNDAHDTADDTLTPVGEAHFRVRYMPVEIGKHTFHCNSSGHGTFRVVARLEANSTTLPSSPRVSANGQHFERCHGEGARCTPMWLVGENIAWGGAWPYHVGSEKRSNGSGLSTLGFYERVLPKLAGVGGNFFRLWLGPSLVRDVVRKTWNDGRPSTFSGLCLHCRAKSADRFGEYSLEAAWRLDRVLTLARALRVTVLMTIESFQVACSASPHAPHTMCMHSTAFTEMYAADRWQTCVHAFQHSPSRCMQAARRHVCYA